MSQHKLDRDRLPWTEAETDRLAEMYLTAVARRDAWVSRFKGDRRPLLGIEQMAEALGRSFCSVEAQINRTGMAVPGAKLRSCIPCVAQGRRRMFFSWGPGNRRCRDCEGSELLRCA